MNGGSCPTHPLAPSYNVSPTSHPPIQRSACLISLEVCCSTRERKHRCKVGKQVAMATKTPSCSASVLKQKLKSVMWLKNEDADVKVLFCGLFNFQRLSLFRPYISLSADPSIHPSSFSFITSPSLNQVFLGNLSSYIPLAR